MESASKCCDNITTFTVLQLHSYYHTAKSLSVSCQFWLVLCCGCSRVRARLWGLLVSACVKIMTTLSLQSSLPPFGNLTVRQLIVVTHIWLLWPFPRLTAAAFCPFREGRRLCAAQQNWAAWFNSVSHHGSNIFLSSKDFLLRGCGISDGSHLFEDDSCDSRVCGVVSWERPSSVLAPVAGSGMTKDRFLTITFCATSYVESTQLTYTFSENKA